jgi:hypothetical protein
MKLIPLLVLGSSNLASALQKILWIDGITDSGFGASFVPKINEKSNFSECSAAMTRAKMIAV